MQKPQEILKFLKPNRTGDCRIPKKNPGSLLFYSLFCASNFPNNAASTC